jgi:hypothetical protein
VEIRRWLQADMSGWYLDGAMYLNLSGQTELLAFPATEE